MLLVYDLHKIMLLQLYIHYFIILQFLRLINLKNKYDYIIKQQCFQF